MLQWDRAVITYIAFEVLILSDYFAVGVAASRIAVAARADGEGNSNGSDKY